jgi:2-dehydropantoate 2-reductase
MSSPEINDSPALKVAVLGAGAMGSLFGGWLAEGGSDVCLVDINQAHLDAVARDGLRLVTDRGDRRIRLRVGRPGDDLGAPDVVLVFTKTMHTRAALAASQNLIMGGATLVSMQNGLGNLEILSEFAPAARIIVGMTTYPADFHGPGDVGSHGAGKVRFMSADGKRRPILQRLEAAFAAGGVDAAVDPRVMISIWEKVAFNAALNSICATTGRTVGEVGAGPEGRALVREVVGEVAAVAHAAGVEVDIAAIHDSIDHALDHHLDHKPSMLQDVLAGRATEVGSINGAVVAQAVRLGIQAPVTETLLRLVRIVERRRAMPA